MYIPKFARALTAAAAAVTSFTTVANLKQDSQHKWMAPASGAVRGPCPALNVLANYGFIDRSGKKLSLKKINEAMMAVYGFDEMLINGMLAGGWLAAGNNDLTIDLNKLAKHSGVHIEHDGSFTRANAPLAQSQSAPLEKSSQTFNSVMALGGSKGFTLDTFAKARVMREGDKPLGKPLSIIAQGESAMLYHLFRDRKTNIVPIAALRSFLWDEKLPDSYVKPTPQLKLPDLDKIRKEIEAKMATIRKSGGTGGKSGGTGGALGGTGGALGGTGGALGGTGSAKKKQ